MVPFEVGTDSLGRPISDRGAPGSRALSASNNNISEAALSIDPRKRTTRRVIPAFEAPDLTITSH